MLTCPHCVIRNPSRAFNCQPLLSPINMCSERQKMPQDASLFIQEALKPSSGPAPSSGLLMENDRSNWPGNWGDLAFLLIFWSQQRCSSLSSPVTYFISRPGSVFPIQSQLQLTSPWLLAMSIRKYSPKLHSTRHQWQTNRLASPASMSPSPLQLVH